MKKVAALLLILFTMAAFTGTAAAKARGLVVFDVDVHPSAQKGPKK